ncbi:MAG: O-antigen ligase family protein, partial [Bacteroidetes bacterium]|nr:O-antigen ligase family protein [Bacteroidota bacterium]
YKLLSNGLITRNINQEQSSGIRYPVSSSPQTDQHPIHHRRTIIRHPVSGIEYPKSLLTTNLLLLTSYYLLLTSNFLILTLTYSRASWLSLAGGIIIFLILTKKWKFLTVSFSLFTIFVFLVFTIPSLNKIFNKIILKDFNTILESRIYLWEPSLKAAKIGGLIGLGYGISEPDIIVPGTGSHYDGERYVREKGNSTLALIEEVGYIGLILTISPLLYLLYKRRYPAGLGESRFIGRRRINYNVEHKQLFTNSIILASLISFLLHSQFEAWMVGVGSVQLPLFLIFIGLSVQCAKFEVIVK